MSIAYYTCTDIFALSKNRHFETSLAKTFQAFSQKFPNICIWQDSHFIKDLFLFFLSGRPTTTFEILRKAETWHSWHLLEFRMSSLSATKFWVYWRPSLQTCQFSAFLDLFLHWSPVAHWAPTDLERPSFSVLSFCLCILFMRFSRQEYWSDVPFHSPVDHILSELSTMIHLTWVALHSMAHSFIELDK